MFVSQIEQGAQPKFQNLNVLHALQVTLSRLEVQYVYPQHVILELIHLQVMEFALLAPLAVLLALLRLSVNRVLPAM